MKKEIMHISFSGGRTSAYMTWLMMNDPEMKEKYDFLVTFANTGLEHPKTLEFINNCDKYFGFKTVWLEAVVHHESRKAPSHKVVTFETASRNGEPFEEVIKKYGIPNTAFPGCTRDLKVNPINSYLASLGIHHTSVPTAIGIRDDEKRRVSKGAEARNIIYPLIDNWPSDKIDVLQWWSEQAFDLEIDEFEGNCLGCFKKSFKKHFMQIERDPSVYDFHRRMESEHKFTGPQKGSRVFFRSNTDTVGLFRLYEENKGTLKDGPVIDIEANGGCSESCEVYETL